MTLGGNQKNDRCESAATVASSMENTTASADQHGVSGRREAKAGVMNNDEPQMT